MRLLFIASTLALSAAALAQDPRVANIYPYKPGIYTTQEVLRRISAFTEEAKPLVNVYQMDRLREGAARIQPWEGFYWSLNEGQIANTWQDKSYLMFWRMLNWEGNVNRWKKRRAQKLVKGINMSDEELRELAPSEKYDLLMGNTNFDLTTRIWDFVETWGNDKYLGYLTSIDMPPGYRLPDVKKKMAAWEGICHGWATAATGWPRPSNTVNIPLPNGKILPFYPADLKALASLMFANSMVQSNVLSEGLRCNEKDPKQDQFGRYVDEPRKAGITEARCSDVHPGVFHAAIVNVMGIQGRGFVADVDYHMTVNNHPMASYKFEWFNPKTGKKGDIYESVADVGTFEDLYRASRNPDTRKIVGVKMKYKYIKWERPKDRKTDGPEHDDWDDKEFRYDLELDAQGNIIGGQWRADTKIRTYGQGDAPKINMPDFIWVLPKNYMDFFQGLTLENWDGRGFVPATWVKPAYNAHSFVYQMTREYGTEDQCSVFNERDSRDVLSVTCEFKYPRPQPLINVVKKLFELSR